MSLRARKYLSDVLESCRNVIEFADGRTFEEYNDSKMLRAAIRSELGIIGEAMVRILHHAPELGARIPESRRNRGLSEPAGASVRPDRL